MCVAPRPGTTDSPGTRTDENNWLRSWTNELYLWYSEVTDRDPASYTTPAYFDLLKTNATTPSGQPKDKFHFTYDTDEWQALSQGGIEAGYGAVFAILAPAPPRRIVVAFIRAGSTPADRRLLRGDEILQVDGADAVNGNTQAMVDALNAGLFPDDTGETHTFVVREHRRRAAHRDDDVRKSSPRSGAGRATVFNTPIGTSATSCSTITSPPPKTTLEAPSTTLGTANVTRPDPRPALQRRRLSRYRERARLHDRQHHADHRPTFEKLVFNDKYPSRNPVTGETLAPTPFHSTSQGFSGTAATRRCRRST